MHAAHGCRARAPLTNTDGLTYLCCGAQKRTGKTDVIMSNSKRTTFSEVLGVIGDALATAAAVRNGYQPHARNLRGLGIDPEQFRKIRL